MSNEHAGRFGAEPVAEQELTIMRGVTALAGAAWSINHGDCTAKVEIHPRLAQILDTHP